MKCKTKAQSTVGSSMVDILGGLGLGIFANKITSRISHSSWMKKYPTISSIFSGAVTIAGFASVAMLFRGTGNAFYQSALAGFLFNPTVEISRRWKKQEDISEGMATGRGFLNKPRQGGEGILLLKKARKKESHLPLS